MEVVDAVVLLQKQRHAENTSMPHKHSIGGLCMIQDLMGFVVFVRPDCKRLEASARDTATRYGDLCGIEIFSVCLSLDSYGKPAGYHPIPILKLVCRPWRGAFSLTI
jgi:hypothetical protein